MFQVDFRRQDSEFSGKLRRRAHGLLFEGCQALSPEGRDTAIVSRGTKMNPAQKGE